MRFDLSACFSVLGAAGHAGGANAANRPDDYQRACAASARPRRIGAAAPPATRGRRHAPHLGGVDLCRAHRTIHRGEIRRPGRAGKHCRARDYGPRWRAIAGRLGREWADEEIKMQQTGDHRVTTLEALEALYDKPYGPAIVKEIDRINPHYRKFI